MKIVKVLTVGCLLFITIGCGRSDDLDLSGTYFAMGLNYEWTYERHDWWVEWPPDAPEPNSGETYDTFTVTVTDSSLTFRGWEFALWGEGCTFRDVGSTPEIIGRKVKIFYDEEKVDILPEEKSLKYGEHGLVVEYYEDTLVLTWVIEGGRSERYGILEETKRIEGIGIVHQRYYNWYWGNIAEAYEGIDDRLLWFCIGDDTIWHYEDTISNIIF